MKKFTFSKGITMRPALLVLVLVVATCAFAEDFAGIESGKLYNINYNSARGFYLSTGAGGLAQGSIKLTGNQTGWHVLEAQTNLNASKDDWALSYAFGYLEGAITNSLIWSSWMTYSNRTAEILNPVPTKLSNWLISNQKWLRAQVSKYNTTSSYWRHVGLILNQVDGMYRGYNDLASADKKITPIQWIIYYLKYEVDDIVTAVNVSVSGKFYEGGHCSVIVKLSSDKKRLYCSHDTWGSFSSMLRIWKHYHIYLNDQTLSPLSHPDDVNLRLANGSVLKSKSVSQSVQPGFIMSGDDFFVLDTKLAVTETTNDVFNLSLFKFVTPQTVPYWVRVTLANRLADNGLDWTNLFYQYNSGTYSNQWMVVDYKKFTPGSLPQAGALYVSEQIPGGFEMADMTNYLNANGSWVSYNVPYFPRIFATSGWTEMENKFGARYSWSQCARAQIFRREAPSVETLDDVKRIMRFNQFQTDPLSLQDACKAISARCDLNTPWTPNTNDPYSPFGGIDCKITDQSMINQLQSVAVSGPTWDSQPPFAWTNQWIGVPHYGQPKTFAFDFVTQTPAFPWKP